LTCPRIIYLTKSSAWLKEAVEYLPGGNNSSNSTVIIGKLAITQVQC